MTADLILHNGVVRTMAGSGQVAEAIALRGDRIAAVGSFDELRQSWLGRDTRTFDLGGRAVLPGFVDAHVHFEQTALALTQAVDCRTPPVSNLAEMVERLRERAARTPPGEWVMGQGMFFQDTRLADGRYPDRRDLDRVSQDHPVLVRFSFHVAVLNSYALRLCGIDRSTPDPPGGQVQRDEQGEPTGMTRDMVHHLHLPPPTPQAAREALLEVGHGRLLANGVTSIQEISGSLVGLAEMASLVRSGALPLRVALALHVPGTVSLEDALDGRPGGVELDDDWFTDGGIKLFADGGTTANAAAFHQPYANEPSTSGRLAYTSDELAELFGTIHRAGRRVSIHAVGDRAQDTVLDGFERFVRTEHPEGHRHRVEHAGNLVTTDERLRRYQALGLTPAPNPTFIHTFGDAAETYLGPRRARGLFRFRTMLDMGFTLPGNSDCTGPEPLGLSPLFNVWCAATRRTYKGNLLDPDEAISVEEGLSLFTRHAARGLGQEDLKGTLEAGKLADLVVLAEDPCAVPVERVRDVAVDLTFVAGRPRFRRPGASAPPEEQKP